MEVEQPGLGDHQEGSTPAPSPTGELGRQLLVLVSLEPKQQYARDLSRLATYPSLRDCGSHSMSAQSAPCRPSACRKVASTGVAKGAPSAHCRAGGTSSLLSTQSREQARAPCCFGIAGLRLAGHAAGRPNAPARPAGGEDQGRTGDWPRPRTAVNTRRVLSERRRRFPQVLPDDEGGLRKAPDNRHEEGDERALRRRSSESRRPCVMRWRPARAQRSVDRGARGPAIEPRKLHCPGRRRGRRCGRQHRWRRYRESPAGPAWSENPCTCATSSCREPGDLALALAW